MALLRHDCGLWLKLGDCNLAFLRSKHGPKLVGRVCQSRAFLRSCGVPSLGSESVGALLRRLVGSHKLVGKGGSAKTFLRTAIDPSLTGGSGHKVTFLCNFVGSHITLRHHHIRMDGLYIFNLPNIPNNFTFGHLLQDSR